MGFGIVVVVAVVFVFVVVVLVFWFVVRANTIHQNTVVVALLGSEVSLEEVISSDRRGRRYKIYEQVFFGEVISSGSCGRVVG